MKHSFSGKVCVVTGAGSGIGRALAQKLTDAGAILALSDIDAGKLAETAELIGAGTANAIRTDVLDVSDPAAIEPYAARVRESLGPADCLFNVAGVTRIGRFRDTPLSSMEKVMDVNYWSVVRMTKAFLPQLIETKGGVVNISSLFGLIGVPNQTHYCSSKFAVRGFNEALAAELAEDGVAVTSVHPGGVKTNIARDAAIDALPPGYASHDELADRFSAVARTSPERAAEIILAGAARRARRVMVGADSRILSFAQRLFPASYMRLLGPLFAPKRD